MERIAKIDGWFLVFTKELDAQRTDGYSEIEGFEGNYPARQRHPIHAGNPSPSTEAIYNAGLFLISNLTFLYVRRFRLLCCG